MREILFKAKRKDNGEWIEGSLVYKKCLRDNGLPEIYYKGWEEEYFYIYEDNAENNIEEYPTKFVEVIPYTICQYTGLTDKNGKKIFENDKVKYDYEFSPEIGIVNYNQENASWQIKEISSSSMKHHDRLLVIENKFDEEVN